MEVIAIICVEGMQGKSQDIWLRDDVISAGWEYDHEGFKVAYIVRLKKIPPDKPLPFVCEGGFPVYIDQLIIGNYGIMY